MSSKDERKKRPSGSQPFAKRLFSLDLNKSSKRTEPQATLAAAEKSSLVESQAGSSDVPHDSRPRVPVLSKRLDFSFMEKPRASIDEGQDPFSDSPSSATSRGGIGGWGGGRMMDSPDSASAEDRSFSPQSSTTNLPGRVAVEKSSTSASSGWRRPRKKPSMLSARSEAYSESNEEPSSPSKLRWDHVRQHVLPTSTALRPPPPIASSSIFTPPSRPGTPTKQFRLGKLGFKQVVEHVQEVSGDQAERFAKDVWDACWMARFGEQRAQKPEREVTPGAFNLTFMSNASVPGIPGLGNSSTASLSTTMLNKRGLRRPPSMQSLASSSRSTPTVLTLSSVLSRYSSLSATSQDYVDTLPHEAHVLSTLLIPFLNPVNGSQIDAERIIAIEAFEVSVKSWRADSNAGELQRCLWCCKAMFAGSLQKHIKMRLLGVFSSCLFTPQGPFRIDSPLMLQTVLQAMFSLLAFLSLQPNTLEATQYVRELIAGILNGSAHEFDGALVEKEYGITYSAKDAGFVRDCTVVLALSACIENDTAPSCRWALQYLVDEYWPSESALRSYKYPFVDLCIRRLNRFLQTLLSLFRVANESSKSLPDVDIITRLLRTRIIPEAEAIDEGDVSETRALLVMVVLNIFSLEGSQEQEYLKAIIQGWHGPGSPWKLPFEKGFQRIVEGNPWPSVVAVLTALVEELSDDIGTPLTAFFLPILNDRLVKDPPEYPFPRLTELLDTISHTYPKMFYKPLFACAAAAKDTTIITQLRIIFVLARFLPQFWTRDVEMLLVALMSDSKPPSKAGQVAEGPVWGHIRMGQLVVFTELIAHVQSVSQEKESLLTTDQTFAVKAGFFFALESRLGALLEAKERIALIPVALRAVLCVLFYETRLLVRSLKPAPWLARTISWAIANPNDDAYEEAEADEPSAVFNKLAGLYVESQERPRVLHQRNSTHMLSASVTVDSIMPAASITDLNANFFSHLSERIRIFETFSKGLMRNALRLFVAVSGLLDTKHHMQLSSVLWRQCLDGNNLEVQASATFLIMQNAEKNPNDFLRLIRDDIQSPENSTRLRTARRLSTLSSWRFQLLSQKYIIDKHHRRPFKLARGPIAFVATDIGSSHFVLEEDGEELKDSNGIVLPLELRKRLLEIGWTDDDKPVDQQHEWIKTPMSLFPSAQMDRLEVGSSFAQSRSPSPMDGVPSSPVPTGEVELGRVHSSYNTVRRRAIFVPPLATVLPDLAALVSDSNYAVATAARNTIIDFMRDDPTLLFRPVLDLLSEGGSNINSAISTLRAFLHVHRHLPPAMAHHLFNHITGFLKYTAKLEAPNALGEFAYSIPILSQLVDQVSEMSIREIRRAKVEIFLIPSGALWFPPSAPGGPMFPKSLTDSELHAQSGVPLQLAQVTVVRIAQNMFFLNLLKRNPGDVQAVRKNMSRLVLPSVNGPVEAPPIELNDLVPRKETPATSNPNLAALSLILCRSYILLIAQIFRSMPRHLSDRSEFAVLADGLNRCLLVHGDDIGIVSQVIIAFMVASARFRRMFTSGGGYTAFMPAIIKVYAESELNQGIRAAIEYAVGRFYSLHQEAFVFQSLDAVSHVAMMPTVDGPWMANHLFALFSTLKDSASQFAPDAAGIHDLNKVQEREALLVNTAEDKPQAFLSLLKRGAGQNGDRIEVALPDQYENGHLALDDLVRLFLTVIGHDPAIRRAESFLHLLRFMAPKLYDASPLARKVLDEGIDALSIIFLTRSAGKTKVPEAAQIRPVNNFSYEVWSQQTPLSNDLHGKSKEPSDLSEMRLDYLSLVNAFTGSGGNVGSSANQRVFELVKLILRDGGRGGSDRVAAFLAEYTRTSLVHEEPVRVKNVLAFLTELAPVFKAYASMIDFSGVLDVLSSLASKPFYAKEPSFSRMVVSQFCVVGLEACELVASENLLFSSPFRPALIKLLTQSIFLFGVDITEELQNRTPSYDYMAGIIFPLVLTLPSTQDTVRDSVWTDAYSRGAPRRAWIRLLSLVMRVFQRTETPRDSTRSSSIMLERTKSQEKRRNMSRSTSVMVLSVALQILKIIVIRAEHDLSNALPGIWFQIGSSLRSLLADGDAGFALQSQDISEPPSPLPLPSPKGLRPTSLEDLNPFTPPGSRGASPTRFPFSQPRLIDYLLWSTLEFICLYRCPLFLQLRILMQEKVAILGQDMQGQRQPHSNRLSFASVFSKRRRGSGHWSNGPSPENSPLLSASRSFPVGDLLSTPVTPQRPAERQPGYARFASPLVSGAQEYAGPKIVHLGPVRGIDPFRRSLSPNSGLGGQIRLTVAKSTTLKSISLVQATYRRIRVVQHLMCYPTLLPELDGVLDDAEDVKSLRAWTVARALREVSQETTELMEEFRETFSNDEDEGIMIEADQSFTG